IEFSVGRSPLNDDVFPFHVAKLAQTLPECLDAGRVSGKGGTTQVSNRGDLRRRLRLDGKRCGEETTGHGTEECSTLHYSITWSARASSDGGIVRPRALAVLRLITSSNLVGCSTGRSAGFAPLRILSTNTATRRSVSSVYSWEALRPPCSAQDRAVEIAGSRCWPV